MKLNIVISFLLTSLFLTACGGGGSGADTTSLTTNEKTNTSLNNGRWSTNPICINQSKGSRVLTTMVSDTRFTVSVKRYETSNCLGTKFTPLTLEYALSYGSSRGYNSSVCKNLHEVDLELIAVIAGTNILSEEKINNAGIPKKTFSLMCSTTDRLYLGSKASTPQTRPTKVNEVSYYSRLSNNTWIKGKFNNASIYKNKCNTPRVNVVNPLTGNFYNDTKGSLLNEKNWLRSLTNDKYLWYTEVTDQDPNLFNKPKEYFKTLKTQATTSSGKPKDKYHFTIPSDEYIKQSQSGVTYGYGAELIAISKTVPRDLRISYTQPNSPAAAKNLIRGIKILEIDGIDFVNATGAANQRTVFAALSPKTLGESHTFKVEHPITKTIRTITMQSSEVTIRPVQNVKVLISATDKKVGYMLFNEHIATAEKQLINAITTFKNEDVDDLVIDLRYNGGGALYIAAELASMIAGPDTTKNRIAGKLKFNNKHSPISVPFFTKTPSSSETPNIALPNLNLTRVFVLTGSNTCSASEALINSLRGVDLEVIQIGSTTCGKPYGFKPEENCGTTYFSISFEIVNAKGVGGYSDGFTPLNEINGLGKRISGCYVPDDFSHQLGDASEKRLAAALFYQAFGQCPVASSRSSRRGDKSLSTDGEMVKPIWLKNTTIN